MIDECYKSTSYKEQDEEGVHCSPSIDKLGMIEEEEEEEEVERRKIDTGKIEKSVSI